MIHGVDMSRYQAPHALDGQAFAICHVDDPGVDDKIDRAIGQGVAWGLYTWVYPGGGPGSIHRAMRVIDRRGAPPVGTWLDYEEAGVSPWDLSHALDTARAVGIFERLGVYTYLYQIAGVADWLEGRPLWLAYYPGNNDGTYPARQIGDAQRWGAVLWQYTSGANAAVGLDRNVVVDEAWYHEWLTGSAPAAPTTHN